MENSRNPFPCTISPDRILRNVSMKDYTSIRIGGRAEVMVFPKDIQELQELLIFLKEKGLPYFVLGNGTNLLVRDEGIKGVVINLTKGFLDIEPMGRKGKTHFISFGAGLILSQLISFSIEKSLEGLEFLQCIPGTLGGAIAMNAGAFGSEIADLVEDITVFSNGMADICHKRDSLNFQYRNLSLPEGSIIHKATLQLKEGNKGSIINKIAEISYSRRLSQPLDLPSAGCVFKNPQGYHAGKLIEELGLKGKKIGDVQFSEIHGNFLVNLGRATFKDCQDLIQYAQNKVLEHKGISLELEVKIW